MKGRKPTPTKLKMLRGNPGHRPLPKNEPQSALLDAEPPGDLSADEQRIWATVFEDIAGSGVVTRLDRPGFRLLVETIADYEDARRTIQEEGPVAQGRDGPKAHPRMPELTSARAEMHRLLAEFGMLPAQRSRVVAHVEAEENPIEAIRRMSRLPTPAPG